MAKFSFPVPGRKKHPPKVTVTAPPASKAQRILGSTALNIDAPRSWDESSTSGMSISVSETTATTNYSSYASTTRANPKYERGIVRSDRDWEMDSEILPRTLRTDGLVDDEADFRSDMSSILRKRQSSSTLTSWYDKTKQPLSISQQTSNSAMAKGLPPKAQRLLDMDHAQTGLKSKKKKPAMLDFSHFGKPRAPKRDSQQAPWEGPMLAPDHVTKSPSLMSPLTPPPPRGRMGGSLRKKSTKESLRSLRSIHSSAGSSEPPRPVTSHSTRRGQHHLNGLPNLYEHYEQMSFRQVMGDYEGPEEVDEPKAAETRQPQNWTPPVPKLPDHLQLPGHHDERVISQYANRNLPQTPQGSSLKLEESPPTDCAASISAASVSAASVSSRHTRTSKASKRTDRSFQDSDLMEKSVLSLSSDSEDDMYVDQPMRSPASVSDLRSSDMDFALDSRPTTARTTESVDRRLSRSSKGSKRASFAPANTYLTIPNGHSKLPTITDRSSSASGSSANTVLEVTSRSTDHSPSRGSVMSNSSANTTMTWQSKPGFGIQEARAITLVPAQGPAESESETEPEVESYNGRSYMPETLAPSADQPTPPLSPSSVDFYIRSAHSSVDGQVPGSHNRFMAVTRQEEMLLAALRHKRQVMRETMLSELEEGLERRQMKGHISKPSEATITESNFDFDFPAPPTCKDRTGVKPNGTTVIDVRGDSNETQPEVIEKPTKEAGLTESLSFPVPPRTSPKRVVNPKKPHHEAKDDGHGSILLYLDRPIAQEYHIEPTPEEEEPSPDLSDFIDYEDESSGSEVVSEVLQRTQSYRSSRHGHAMKTRSSMPFQSPRPFRASATSTIIEEEVGVPRPDSPISPDGLGAPPPRKSTVNKKTARLSAVGPARWGDED